MLDALTLPSCNGAMYAEFMLDPELIYLNHAAVSPWPERTVRAVQQFAAMNGERGAADYPAWVAVERRLRARLAWLIGVSDVDGIALVKNTSEGLSLLAYGLDWRAGDSVVIPDGEFPSNRLVWQSLVARGVRLIEVDIGGTDPETALLAACDGRTRLLSVSSVQFANGFRLDVNRLGLACRARGILFCVDAIQSLGALEFDAEACCADVVVGDGHKWMCGPEGIALFYVRDGLRQQLHLRQYGWHMVEAMGDYSRRDWQPASSARRFEPGSPNMLGIHALEASLSMFAEFGMEHVEQELLQRSRWLAGAIKSSRRIQLLSSSDPARQSGIVTFAIPGCDHALLAVRLLADGVVCAPRGGGIRFSPHFYTPMEELEQALRIVARLA